MEGHGRLVVALQLLPVAAYVWDDLDPDVTWDDTTPQRVWDAPFVGAGYTDAWCDLVRLELAMGMPDVNDSYRAGYCRLELRDPGDGRYRARTPDGRLAYFAPGRRVAIYWLDETDTAWWLFHGAVATWRDPLLTPTVMIEAYDVTATLAQTPGAEWTVGTTGDTAAQRVGAILAASPVPAWPHRFDTPGLVDLSVPAAENRPPIDAMRQAARSDGGVIFADADDTLVLRDRFWRDGRTDQDAVPVLTDNVCNLAGSVVVWEPEAADVDERLAGRVVLTNDATPPLVAAATGVPYGGPALPSTIVWTPPEPDLWRTQAQGDALAQHIANERVDARMALEAAQVLLHDRRFDYWHQILQLRLGDLVRFQHVDSWTGPPPTSDLYDLTMVLTTLVHNVTPDTWQVTVGTSPAVDYTSVELWDWTLLTWDDPNPLAVWR